MKESEKTPEKTSELAKAYDAKTVDAKWYAFWKENDYFKADPNSTKPAYCIVMPPPNVTGALHMGHALVNTLQDILIRWKRMSGFETLWVPGTDHAGISTQTIVERHLMRTLNKKRKDFPRDEFLKHVWSWKEEKEHNILTQLKRVGCSCDWSSLRFTMDEGNNRAVRTVFKKMFDQGLIYRGDYLVNWDPVTQTAIADDEVEHEERQSLLWHFKYPLQDGSGYVQVATTRPETMLGDTAIAVSPKDPRYTHLIGKKVILPLMDREIPIIADHHVDPVFGTGMVKVTPAHDPNDYQMGLTHHLPFISIMTPDGHINESGGRFEGLTMEEARAAVVEAMNALGLLVKTEPHVNRVGVSYRSKATIEPYMSKQWFVRMDGFAKKLQAVVRNNKTTLIPQNWENTYFHWVDNLRDWCISRQLWWGHRIPIWYNINNPSEMICYDGEGIPPQVTKEPDSWVQDSDVLDTWFSSALWPFSTLGWPENTQKLKKFYPNAVLVTGHDILFFWVARMLLMGEYIMDEVPFPQVFLHGLIYGKSYWRNIEKGGIAYLSDSERKEYEMGKPIPKDVHSKWEKMSKSKGNIIDPLEIIDEYGTDAMRMALCASATQAREIDLDRRRFEEFRNFANKLWNGARFVLMNLEGDNPLTADELHQGLDENLLGLEDRWILSKLSHTIQNVNKKLNDYTFDQAALEAYDFFWKEFCAYYLELVKPVLFGKAGSPEERKNKQKMLLIVLCQAIRLIHPMAPFITEELFQTLKEKFDKDQLPGDYVIDPYTVDTIQSLHSPACIVASYPKILRQKDLDLQIENTFALIEQAVYSIRNIRGEMKLQPNVATAIHITGLAEDSDLKIIKSHHHLISALVRTTSIEIHHSEPTLGFASTAMLNAVKIAVPLPEELIKQENTRLAKEKDRLTIALEKVQIQLDNKEFVDHAPPQLVEKQKLYLQQLTREIKEIDKRSGVA